MKPRFKVAVHRDASALPWYAHAVEYKLFAAAEEYGVAVEELPEAVVRVAHRELQGSAGDDGDGLCGEMAPVRAIL